MAQKTPHKQFAKSGLRMGLALLVVIFTIYQITVLTRNHSLKTLSTSAILRVNLYSDSLKDNLEKYRHIPYMLARDNGVLGLLNNSLAPTSINQHLEDFGLKTDALLFILDIQGTTVAASNWRSDASLIGHNFSFRPYFTDALEGKEGGYYAVGKRTMIPGFYISYPVREKGIIKGVAVVKLDLEPLQQSWRESGETIVVSDASGVMFLSSNKDWKYRSLRKLPPKTINWLRDTQYSNLPLAELEIKRKRVNNHNVLIIEQRKFIEQALQLPRYGWRIHYLTDMQSVEKDMQVALITSSVIVSLLLFALLYMKERRQKIVSQEEAKKAIAIQQINEKLLYEIEEHKKTEQSLLETQSELIQAGKLAALGRMSAAIAHELNQPVTAIRTFVASCKIFLQRKQPEELLENLEFISKLTDRMGKLTGQLKTFARKSKGREELFDPIETVKKVILFLGPQCNEHDISLKLHIEDNFMPYIKGDSLQLEQVVSNLLHNSIDALAQVKIKQIHIEIKAHDNQLSMLFEDSGPGIDEKIQDILFDPFFTTKEIGKGLGLGLSITYTIIQEMNGTIRAESSHLGGAKFSILLPLAKQPGGEK